MSLYWDIKPFEELDIHTLYAVLKLRQKVFVVEQDCPYLDNDGYDQKAYHLMGRSEHGELLAYCRLIRPTDYYKESSIGRVVTAASVRGIGAGRDMMKIAVQVCESLFPDDNIRIMAQYYLLKFYTELSFKAEGDIFLEDGIEHIEMVYQVKA